MASGKFDLTKTLGVSSYIYSRCEWSSSGSIDTNKSTMTVRVIVGKKSGSNTPTTCTFNTTVSVSGAEYPSSQSSSPYDSVSANEEIVVFTGTFVVPHGDDGNQSTTISVSIGNNNVYHASGSATVTLDTIKRATELPSFSSLTVESSTVFTLDPYISNAKHSVKFRCGNTQSEAINNPVTKWLQSNGSLGTNEIILSGKTLTINIPASLYNVFDGSVGHIAMTLYTYTSGSTLVDSKTKWVKLLPGSSCTPVITATVVDTNDKTILATGGSNNIVANASILRVTPTIQISDPDDANSWIVSKSIDGVAFTESTKTIPKPSKRNFLVSATNNRGLTGNYTATVTGRYIPYVDLTFNIEDINRVEPTSDEIVINYNGKFYAGEFTDNLGSGGTFNQLSITWGYKIKGSSGDFITGGTLRPTIDATKNTYTGSESLGELFDYKNTYEFKFVYTDIINSHTRDKVYVTKGEPILWWNEDTVRILGELLVNEKAVAIADDVTQMINNLTQMINKLTNVHYTNTSAKTVNFSTAWTWYAISDDITIQEDGTYLLLYSGWISGIVDSVMECDVAFDINHSGYRPPRGSCSGGTASANEVVSLGRGDIVNVIMQTDKTGTVSAQNNSLIAVKLS